MKLECFLLVFVLFASTIAKEEVNIGVWSPIVNINDDPHVTEIANFAVTRYDKESGETLKLAKVIKGDTQEVSSGTYYRLTVTANNGSSSNNYEAIVWEMTLLHFKNLVSFTPTHV